MTLEPDGDGAGAHDLELGRVARVQDQGPWLLQLEDGMQTVCYFRAPKFRFASAVQVCYLSFVRGRDCRSRKEPIDPAFEGIAVGNLLRCGIWGPHRSRGVRIWVPTRAKALNQTSGDGKGNGGIGVVWLSLQVRPCDLDVHEGCGAWTQDEAVSNRLNSKEDTCDEAEDGGIIVPGCP